MRRRSPSEDGVSGLVQTHWRWTRPLPRRNSACTARTSGSGAPGTQGSAGAAAAATAVAAAAAAGAGRKSVGGRGDAATSRSLRGLEPSRSERGTRFKRGEEYDLYGLTSANTYQQEGHPYARPNKSGDKRGRVPPADQEREPPRTDAPSARSSIWATWFQGGEFLPLMPKSRPFATFQSPPTCMNYARC